MEEFLIKNRKNICSLPEYLGCCTFQDLIDELHRMENENKYPVSLSYIHELLLGKIGFEHNKQMAIYELPTIELLELIEKIIDIFAITSIEEIMAGLGLLSKTLELHVSKKNIICDIFATDGNRWIETSGEPTYFPVEKKLLLQYVLEDQIFPVDKLVLMSWIGKNTLQTDSNQTKSDIKIFIDEIEPPILLLIGSKSLYKDLIESISESYIFCVIEETKQICYRDYFLADRYIQNSSVILVIHKNKMNLYDKDELSDLLSEHNISITFDLEMRKENEIFQDMVGHKIFPSWYLELSEDDQKVFIELFDKSEQIPDYIQSFSDYKFYINLTNVPDFTSKDKFQEFKTLYDMIDKNTIDELKRKSILPKWIFTKEIAKKFVFTDYSTTEKSWKESFPKFMNKFNDIISEF
jgi:hypothetical protein